jgi:hypothetical protein
MRLLILFLFVLLLIGGGMKLLGAQLPGIDYPFFSGPMGQPQYERVEPDLNLP